MHYQTNKNNRQSYPYNISPIIQNISNQQKSSTVQPKNLINFNNNTQNFIPTENSENTINNINPLTKSKDSNSHHRNSSHNNLFSAVEYNDIEKAEQILKNDPSQINELNDEGISPLHISVIKANLKMINLLLKYGANANILSEKKKQTPLHLAYLNQNSMTEEILQELKNYNACDSIYDSNNKKPSDYLNNSYLKNYYSGKKNNNSDGYSSSADKRQIQSNTNTVMVITNENHFDSFMTTNKDDDNKSNINSTINNNNTIQTPSKLEAEGNNMNEFDYNNEPTITINSNNKYNTNNTNNTNNTIISKSDSMNRRQYTFGKEEDYHKFQRKNSENNINNMLNNNSIKNIEINYNNINNGIENDDFLQKLIDSQKLKEISQQISPSKIQNKKIKYKEKNELNDSLEEEQFNNINANNSRNNINKNKFNTKELNAYMNDNSNSILNIDSFTRKNGLISNSILTYTDSININGSNSPSKKVSPQGTITNIINSNNLRDNNIDDIELKLPYTNYNNNKNILNNENIDKSNNNNDIIINNNTFNINPNSNLNIDDLYKKIILKKRDSIIKSHKNCNSGILKYEKKHIDNSGFNIDINNNSMININYNKNNSFNSQNSSKNTENNNINKTVIHNTSKDNSSFRNITIIHNNNINGIYEGNNNISYFKEKENNDNNISLFTTKSQTKKLKPNGLITNNINENIIELNKDNIFPQSRNINSSNNNSFLTNNNSDLNNFTIKNNKNISEFKYLDNFNNNNNLNNNNNNMVNNSNDNSNININEIINEDVSNNSKNILSSLKYWLNNINLINYYPNFINNSIIDISVLIEKMKSYQTKLKFENIESILKIRKPGHIYRILCRLEVDANLIDNKVTKFLLKNSEIFNKNEFYLSGGFDKNNNNNLHLLISQDYQCLGCCKTNRQFSNVVKNDLKSFLKRYGLLNFYQNFYHNGFELIEYVILQMYGGYPINDEILENCFHVYDEEQRKKILKAIVSEMKKINEFLVSEEYNSNQNMDLIKYENIIFCDENKNSEESKIIINNGKNSNCSIF